MTSRVNLAARGSFKYKRIMTTKTSRTLQMTLCIILGLLLGLSQAKEGHGTRSPKGGGHATAGQHLNQSLAGSTGSGGGGGDVDTASKSNAAAIPTMMFGQVIGQIYLIIVGIVIGICLMYLMCTCRANRIQKEAFQEKVELMKQEVVLDCETTHGQNNNNHKPEIMAGAAPFASPVNGRYIATYMKPWEAFKSGADFTFSNRHDGGSGWIIRGGTGNE